MKPLEKVVIVVKETRYQTIEISERTGYKVPEAPKEVAELAIDISNDVRSFTSSDEWDSGEMVVQSVDWVEEKDQ